MQSLDIDLCVNSSGHLRTNLALESEWISMSKVFELCHEVIDRLVGFANITDLFSNTNLFDEIVDFFESDLCALIISSLCVEDESGEFSKVIFPLFEEFAVHMWHDD